jgi:hypothetical protein
LKRGWMQFWRTASVLLLCVSARAQAQMQPRPRESSTTHPASAGAMEAHRNDELTLGGIRPGRDAIAKALHMFPKTPATGDGGASRTWRDNCRHELLSVIADANGTIIEIRTAESGIDPRYLCREREASPRRWATGHGLVVGDPCSRVTAVYGQPGSRGPSTKGGQQLELFYYAFDWAGPDVPQVMTVLCTPEAQDKPGRVVEITLAAPSL